MKKFYIVAAAIFALAGFTVAQADTGAAAPKTEKKVKKAKKAKKADKTEKKDAAPAPTK